MDARNDCVGDVGDAGDAFHQDGATLSYRSFFILLRSELQKVQFII
jgi:hypothetical protein